MTPRTFASDNASGVHPDILAALADANVDHAAAYGYDPLTFSVLETFEQIFGKGSETFFVFSGTGANVLALNAVMQSWNSIIASDLAHLSVDETGAPEKFTGCKLLTVPSFHGKITVEGIEKHIRHIGFEHSAQPRVVSITQPTELGTLYAPEEVKAIADFCHKNNLLLHVDGARIANAAVALNLNFRELTRDLGVDILSFGGTKNGMLFGEAVVFMDKKLCQHFRYQRKQAMQLYSKMRFVSAQFKAYFSNNLWRRNAENSNCMAALLQELIKDLPGVEITQPVQTNGVFVRVPMKAIPPLMQAYYFYIWDEKTMELRWMCSFDTTENDVRNFVEILKQNL